MGGWGALQYSYELSELPVQYLLKLCTFEHYSPQNKVIHHFKQINNIKKEMKNKSETSKFIQMCIKLGRHTLDWTKSCTITNS